MTILPVRQSTSANHACFARGLRSCGSAKLVTLTIPGSPSRVVLGLCATNTPRPTQAVRTSRRSLRGRHNPVNQTFDASRRSCPAKAAPSSIKDVPGSVLRRSISAVLPSTVLTGVSLCGAEPTTLPTSLVPRVVFCGGVA